MDLIERQAAIDALVRDCKGSDEGMLKMYDIICDLKELPSAQPKQQWIPCSERLPEHTGAYLLTTTVAVDKYVITSWYSTKGGWICDGYPEAWMPLPEPYREDKP